MSLGDLIIRICDLGFGAIEAMRRWLGRPRVETISTSDLHAAMNSEQALRPVLVDVRSDPERMVSRIPNAMTPDEYEAHRREYAGRQVVAYCTVGGRSYLYSCRLVSAGINAMNYRDSILGWCRNGLPLESPDGQETNAVHPYWRVFHVPDQYTVTTDQLSEQGN